MERVWRSVGAQHRAWTTFAPKVGSIRAADVPHRTATNSKRIFVQVDDRREAEFDSGRSAQKFLIVRLFVGL